MLCVMSSVVSAAKEFKESVIIYTPRNNLINYFKHLLSLPSMTSNTQVSCVFTMKIPGNSTKTQITKMFVSTPTSH